jgi:hypothetical protein
MRYLLPADPRYKTVRLISARDLARPLTVRDRAALAVDIAVGNARLEITRAQIAWLARVSPSTVAVELRRRSGGVR